MFPVRLAVMVVRRMQVSSETRTRVEPRDHVVQFYERDEELVETVGAYLGDALRAGEVALVVATEAHTVAFEQSLAVDGISVAHARESGRLITLDARETLSRFMRGDGPDAGAFDDSVGGIVRRASESGRRIRAYGEMVALLWDEGQVAAAIELEALWNELGLQVPFSLFCAYPTQSVSGQSQNDSLREVCHLHSAVVGSPPLRSDLDAADLDESRQFVRALRAPRAARQFVVETLRGWGCERLVADAAVVVTELATNSVVHAHSDFVVTLSSRAGGVRISVRDTSGAPPVRANLAEARLSGRGVALVEAIASRWGTDLDSGGKVVWAEFHR
jgi:anti-sigma regulatory factor (Ser/Thr protein kinase)